MTELSAKELGGLIKSIGPTDEHRQSFGRSFLGSLLGQATVLVGMMLIYVASLVLLHKYAIDDLYALHATIGALAFWSVIAAPLIIILLFSMLPAAWRGLRERRLKRSIIGGEAQFNPGYFRLYPYGAADRADFKRLDGAGSAVLNWLKSTNDSLLYFSGASGAGKSSLLAATILPQLRDTGWMMIEIRLFGEPIGRLREAVLATDYLFTRKPPAELPLRDLLLKAVEAYSKKGDGPLLLVIDQFEEFLILHNEGERRAFTAFLNGLAKNPIDGLRILLVFRSDYAPLIFKLDLPPLAAKKNWFELAPYDRGAATTFLQGGGRQISPEALDMLFRGLDRIEDTRGMYRPITLNMVGMVLERMGRTLEGDPARLIQTYLRDCIIRGSSRDFAKPVLAQMITDAGTKEPQSESELAERTGLYSWQVKATLADLAQQGLVRRLEAMTAMWEISHDFLARLIAQLLGYLKPSVPRYIRPLVAPLVLAGWIILGVIALPSWTTLQERRAEAGLQKVGASFSQAEGLDGVEVRIDYIPDELFLTRTVPLLEKARPAALNLHVGRLTFLDALSGLTNLRQLRLRYAYNITSLESLKKLTNLAELVLLGATGITSLEPLKELTKLSKLIILADSSSTAELGWMFFGFKPRLSDLRITSLEPLKGLTNLSALTLDVPAAVTSLEPLRGLSKLNALDLRGATGITSLEPLRGLTNLNSLDLWGATGVTSLEPLDQLTNLNALDLSHATGITSLEPLSQLTNLNALDLSHATGITSLEPLKGLRNLGKLDLSDATGITSLEPLKGLTNLRRLNLSGATGISSLEPLKGLTYLEQIDLDDATGITSLEPLEGKDIAISGASEKLLATIRNRPN